MFAHGASHLLFFRYRPALFGQEEFCYGVLEHSGRKGRSWREAKELFSLAKRHREVVAAPMRNFAKVALLYDMETAFAWQAQPMSTSFDYGTELWRLYHPFWRNGAAVDSLSFPHLLGHLGLNKSSLTAATMALVAEEAARRLLHNYRVLLLPVPLILSSPLGNSRNRTKGAASSSKDHVSLDQSDVTMLVLRRFIEMGGAIWTSFRGDIKDDRSRIRPEESRLAQLAG